MLLINHYWHLKKQTTCEIQHLKPTSISRSASEFNDVNIWADFSKFVDGLNENETALNETSGQNESATFSDAVAHLSPSVDDCEARSSIHAYPSDSSHLDCRSREERPQEEGRQDTTFSNNGGERTLYHLKDTYHQDLGEPQSHSSVVHHSSPTTFNTSQEDTSVIENVNHNMIVADQISSHDAYHSDLSQRHVMGLGRNWSPKPLSGLSSLITQNHEPLQIQSLPDANANELVKLFVDEVAPKVFCLEYCILPNPFADMHTARYRLPSNLIWDLCH